MLGGFTFEFARNKRAFNFILVFFFICLAAVSEIFFVKTTFNLTNSRGDIDLHSGAGFYINKPGIYTLWVDFGDQNTDITHNIIKQFQIKRSDNGEVVPNQDLTVDSFYRRNGEVFVAICDYSFLSSGRYIFVFDNNKEPQSMLLRSKVSIRMGIMAFCCLVLGVLFVIVAGLLLFKRKWASQ